MTQNLGNQSQARRLTSLVRFGVTAQRIGNGYSIGHMPKCWEALLVRWPSGEDTSVALADHGASLTVITLSRGSRSMWTSKTKGPGQVESVRSSATVLATIGMPSSTSTLRLSR